MFKLNNIYITKNISHNNFDEEAQAKGPLSKEYFFNSITNQYMDVYFQFMHSKINDKMTKFEIFDFKY